MKLLILIVSSFAIASAITVDKKTEKRSIFVPEFNLWNTDYNPYYTPEFFSNQIPLPPHPFAVEIERQIPFPIHVPVNKPYAIHVLRPYPITVEKPVPYEVIRHVPYPVNVPVEVPVIKRVEVPVPRPYSVQVEKPFIAPYKPQITEKKAPTYISYARGSNYKNRHSYSHY